MSITRLTNAFGASTAGSSTSTTAFNAVSGNEITVEVRSGPGYGSINTPTDTAGNTYVLETNATSISNDPNLLTFIAKNITGNASNVVTVTASGTFNYMWIDAVQYSGVHLTTPVDASGAFYGSSAVTDLLYSGINTSTANDMLIMFGSQPAFANYTAGTSFTLVNGNIGQGGGSDYGGLEEYLVSGTLSSFDAHMTSDVSAAYTVAWVALAPAAAATIRIRYYYDMAAQMSNL